MPYSALACLLLAILAGFFAFGGLSGGGASFFTVLFVLFLALTFVLMFGGRGGDIAPGRGRR
jgi:uncharacterized membrane protein YtjA (UPF0391 family)